MDGAEILGVYGPPTASNYRLAVSFFGSTRPHALPLGYARANPRFRYSKSNVCYRGFSSAIPLGVCLSNEHTGACSAWEGRLGDRV